jgi:hypothetical protein
MKPPQPQGLVGGGSLGGYRPGVTPISRTEDARAVYVASGPSQTPMLSVHVDGRCTLNKALLSTANLRGGSLVMLVVPTKHGGDWYLDTQPKPGAGNRLPTQGRALFRVPPMSRNHFRQPQITLAPAEGATRGRVIVSSKETLCPILHFRLGDEVPGHPGYYQLVRVRPGSGTVNH